MIGALLAIAPRLAVLAALAATPAAPARVAPVDTITEEDDEPALTLGGALRLNLAHRDWLRGADARVAGFDFDTFRLNADGSYAGLLFSAEYRFYAGYHMLHHGWVGYAPSDRLTVRAGVSRVPFGALPYASHNWFFQLPYYLGLEDDYDAGLAAVWDDDRLSAALAFYPNSEGAYTGSSVASARYSYDIVPATTDELGYAGLEEDRNARERNQLNGRVAWRWRPSPETVVELGASGQWGQLHDDASDRRGHHRAAAAHVDATHRRWNVIAEVIGYTLAPAVPAGVDERFAVMGAYDAPYRVASRAELYLAGVAYTVPVDRGPIESIRFYDNYTYMDKAPAGYPDTQQNVLGSAISAGPLYVYIDVASGRSHPWLGPDYGAALADGIGEGAGDGAGDPGWHTRVNVNLGYYF